MADSVVTQIINNVKTTIQAIAAGSTYSRTVRVCERLTYLAPQISQYDAVFIYDAGCTKTFLASAKTECSHNLLLDCWVQDDSPGEAIDQLAADVEKALAVDITRGALAADTKVMAIESFVTEDMKPIANCRIEVNILYRHIEGDPYTET